MNKPELSIIVVSYNTEKILQNALSKVYYGNDFKDFEVIVVDNASSDDSCAMVEREFPQVNLIRSSVNAGFAAGNNLGLKAASGKYVLLLNSDAYVFGDSLKESVKFMNENPTVGVMGAQLVCEDGSPQPSARQFPNPWHKFKVMTGIEARYPSYETFYDYYGAGEEDRPQPRKVGWVPGTYFMIRREVIDEIGGLDELFFMYFEEVDYCLRSRKAGWEVVFNPNVTVIHLGGASAMATTKAVSRTGRQLVDIRVKSEYDYYRKHSGLVTVLLAGMVEIGWRTMIYLKNTVLKDNQSQIKINESKLAIELVWKKLKGELKSPQYKLAAGFQNK